MKNDFDLRRILDIPDPLGNLERLRVPSLRAMPIERSPTRSHMSGIRVAALTGSVAYQGVWLALLNKRGDLATLPWTTLGPEVAVPLLIAVIALIAAVGPGAHGIGQAKARLSFLALSAPAIFVMGTLLMGSADVDEESFLRHALRCALFTSTFSAGPFALALWAFRNSFVALAAWRAAALGVASAAIGAATMTIFCSTGSPEHVLVGHGGLLLVGGLAGGTIGKRLARA
jgi:hypothetical protein